MNYVNFLMVVYFDSLCILSLPLADSMPCSDLNCIYSNTAVWQICFAYGYKFGVPFREFTSCNMPCLIKFSWLEKRCFKLRYEIIFLICN